MKINAKDIKPAKYNPRTITAEEKTGLVNSINKFDDIAGITFNIRTGNLVTGHQRWQMLNENYRAINLKKLDINDKKSEAYMGVYDADEYTGFSIRIVNWPEDKEKAANIAANAHTIQGKFDLEALGLMLADLDLDLKTDLRLDKLELDLGLNFEDSFKDKDEVGDLDEGAEALPSNILIKCHEKDRETLIELIKDLILDHELEGVKING